MLTVTPWKYPANYIGLEWHNFYSAGFGQSRDSDTLPIQWRLKDYITPAGLPCFAARHDLSTIMHEYDADTLWQAITQ